MKPEHKRDRYEQEKANRRKTVKLPKNKNKRAAMLAALIVQERAEATPGGLRLADGRLIINPDPEAAQVDALTLSGYEVSYD